MLKNTYAKLCDIIDNLEVVDVIYLNGKKLYYDQILTIINNKNTSPNTMAIVKPKLLLVCLLRQCGQIVNPLSK